MPQPKLFYKGRKASDPCTINLLSTEIIRPTGMLAACGAAQTGRTHDLHPTASRTSNSSCNALRPTHDPERTFAQRRSSPRTAVENG